MTIGPLFTISTINVARAAVREAKREIPTDAPVDIQVGSHKADGSAQLYVEVASHAGETCKIDVDDVAVETCLAERDYDTLHRMVSDPVERLAREISAAAREQLAIADEATQVSALRAALVEGEASGAGAPFDFDDFVRERRSR
ncbi:type II toxin-antitoxin system ParD family antitoxin [Curtobacterium flaccumfaciens pv. poinsettiae]|uniref:type II toxin-antitoxin system ParD family antitoxin n=1 Tax=Curtobacterium poinsettiae TaxID=159612 RepID=UPI001BE0C5B5|nr:type II toxin-antitoxin system ParD family antitoxin [Curtobacterium flaccumfaciens]MBT1619994.1 type II toxin-antitoxin system ParD family antitoxin [Curtobacterium flaccumfaciens pv. poinsettiae]